MANPHREDTKVRRSIDVLREYYSQFTEGKVYESPNGHEIDPVERIVHGELAYFNWKRCSYTSIILNAEPGDVLDDGYIEEFFGHAVHVKEA